MNEIYKIGLNDAHLIQIGLISVHFNRMMNGMRMMIQAIAKDSDLYFEIVLTKIPEKELTRTALESYKHRFGVDQKYKAFEKLLKRVDNLMAERNAILHSLMIPSLSSDVIIGMKPTRKRNGDYYVRKLAYRTDEMEESIHDFYTTTEDVFSKMLHFVRINADEYRDEK